MRRRSSRLRRSKSRELDSYCTSNALLYVPDVGCALGAARPLSRLLSGAGIVMLTTAVGRATIVGPGDVPG